MRHRLVGASEVAIVQEFFVGKVDAKDRACVDRTRWNAVSSE